MPTTRRKTNKSRSDTAVQGTNDCSIVSKYAMVCAGYFKDDYLQYMVAKNKGRRSPLINRGYYIRAEAVDTLIKVFLSNYGEDCQIISLGAGFDTTYFRLSDQGLLSDSGQGTRFIEIDFRDVAVRKARLICNQSTLWSKISRDQCPPIGENGPEVISGPGYVLLGVDLSDLNLLEACWRNLCPSDKPTLLLSECVMTYMTPKSSNSVIHLAADYFTNAVFLTYEQIYPHDAFGKVMCGHFRKLGSPLKGIETFPTPQHQETRYKDAGWTTSAVIPMAHFYQNLLSTNQRARVRSLEMFDESEEWNLKSCHYVIICSESGRCCHLYQTYKVPEEERRKQLEMLKNPKHLHLHPTFHDVIGLCRFGHDVTTLTNDVSSYNTHTDDVGNAQNDDVATLTADVNSARIDGLSSTESDDVIVVTGGFGDGGGGKHSRDLCPVILNVTSGKWRKVMIPGENLMDRSMYHTTEAVSNKVILVFGGRTSPAICFNDVIALKLEFPDINQSQSRDSNDVPAQKLQSPVTDQSRSRDSAENKCIAGINQSDSSMCDDVIGCYERWTVIGCKPCGRWRHASCLVRDEGNEKLYICGGRSIEDKVLDDFYLFHIPTKSWTPLPAIPSPVCSATLNTWRRKLVLSCGLDSDENPTNQILVFDIDENAWTSLKLDSPIQERYSHTSHVIGDWLYLIGGVSLTYPQPGLSMLNLNTGAVHNYLLPAEEEKSKPVMLHNHCSRILSRTIPSFLILGGGGNCFSFGTHLNAKPMTLTFR